MIKIKYITKADALNLHGRDGFVRGLSSRIALQDGYQTRFNPALLPDKLILEDNSNTCWIPAGVNLKSFFSIDLYNRNSDYPYLLLPIDSVKEDERAEFWEMCKKVLEKELPGRYHIIANTVYIWYPEIKITNSIGTTHTIYDFILRLDGNGKGAMEEMYGARVSFSSREISKNFIHPHVSLNGGSWGGFCYGDNTPVSKFLEATMYTLPNEDSFALFLTQMERYLAWESMEGKPYKSINELVASTPTDTMSGTYLMNTIMHTQIAKALVKAITPDMLSSTNNQFLLLPKTCEARLFELEKALITELQISTDRLYDYDPVMETYYMPNGGATRRSLPSRASDIDEVVRALKITPRLIEPTNEGSTLIKRIGQCDMASILTTVNQLLING